MKSPLRAKRPLLETAPAPTGSHFLAPLPAAVRDDVLAKCEEIEYALGDPLCKEGVKLTHVWFPINAVISQISPGPGAPIEVSLVGREGMIGSTVTLGVAEAMLTSNIQKAGRALRMPVRAFLQVHQAHPPFRERVGRWGFYQSAYAARMAACNASHQLEERLARWLMAFANGSGELRFDVTHKFLAMMLGTRRAGVTIAASNLQRRGLIEYTRGHMDIVDARGLERAACECHRYAGEAYGKLLRSDR